MKNEEEKKITETGHTPLEEEKLENVAGGVTSENNAARGVVIVTDTGKPGSGATIRVRGYSDNS